MFLHRFPEIWYSWHHQMLPIAGAGFRAIASDYRGYGLSNSPPNRKRPHLVTLSAISLLFLMPLALKRKGVGHCDNGGAIHSPRKLHNHLPEGFYISRWQELGTWEADFGRVDTKTVVRNIYILLSRSEVNQEIMDLVDPDAPLPPWFSGEDLAAYGALYENSGFQTALQVPYRSLSEEFNTTKLKVEVPVLVIMGGKDYSLKFSGIEDYIKSGKVRDFVPDLEMAFLPERTHFVQEQLPDKVNQLILCFLNNHIQL